MLKFLQHNYDISSLSNYKTPAKARYFFDVKNDEVHNENYHSLQEMFQFTRTNNLKSLIIGGGTNILFAFDEYDGVIIKNSLMGWSYDEVSHLLETFSNEPIWTIAQELETKYHQPLWHRFIGLPGSIGGAIFGNAWCFGLETEWNFVSAKVFNIQSWQIEILEKKDMNFTYRSSILKETEKYFLISATFNLSQKVEKYHSDVDNIDFRENKQPKGNSCGSFFKNPEGVIIDSNSGEEIVQSKDEIQNLKREWVPMKKLAAGYLIEKVGLKGFAYGWAKWSEKHANFLLSDGETCTWRDLLYLIEEAQKRVKEDFGIFLEKEVKIIAS